MEQNGDIAERVKRAHKELEELLEREGLTIAVREELINGQRQSFGIVFIPKAEPQQNAIVAPGHESLSRKVRRMFARNN